jgi:DNA-binding NtrC family response regulator
VGVQRILVVDASPAVRETIGAVLGSEYEVLTRTDTEFFGDPAAATKVAADLLIVGASDLAVSRDQHLPAACPVLWLAPDASWRPPVFGVRQAVVPNVFVPPELRQAVRRLLAPASSDPQQSLTRLRYPYLSAEAGPFVDQALSTRLPVCLYGGGPLVGRAAVARLLHSAGSSSSLFATTAVAFVRGDLDHGAAVECGTLFLDALEQLSDAGAQRLASLVQPDGTLLLPNGNSPRVISGTGLDLDALLQRLPAREVYYRLTTLPIRLTPLRDRAQDIPDLARAVAATLAHDLGLAAVSFTPAALQRLSAHLWFGDVAEIEALLARSLAVARKTVIDRGDLLFDDAPPTAERTVTAASAKPAPPALPAEALDLVINELAHEVKNPLVTIKTFAQHLRRSAHHGADEEQLARMAGEAVDQIDLTVENLVQFTRLDAPNRERVTVAAVLAPAVSALAQVLKPRTRRLDYRPPPVIYLEVDGEQVTYALSNLLRALARGLGDTGRMVVSYADPGRIVIELPIGYDTSETHLAGLLSQRTDRALPLLATLARAVIERNGGALDFDVQQQPPTVTVRFPVVVEEEAARVGNGKTPRTGR